MRKFLALVLALVMTMSLVTVSAGAATDFTDDAAIVNEEAVEVLSAIGILGGYADGSFRPQGVLTRGAGAKMIAYLMLGQEAADALKATYTVFADVTDTVGLAPYIEWAAANGIVGGYGNGNFGPYDTLTQYAFGKMLLTAIGYDSAKEGYTGAGWQKNVYGDAIAKGIYDGTETYAACTRDDAARMVLATLETTYVVYGSAEIGRDGSYLINGHLYQGLVDTKVTVTGAWDTTLAVWDTYEGLTFEGTAYDVWGNPGDRWTYNNTVIGFYEDETVAVYTTQVNLCDVLVAVGIPANSSKEAGFSFTYNGAYELDANTYYATSFDGDNYNFYSHNEKHYNCDDMFIGGQGVLTKVFKTDDKVTGKTGACYHVTEVATYLAAVTDVTKNHKGTETEFSVYFRALNDFGLTAGDRDMHGDVDVTLYYKDTVVTSAYAEKDMTLVTVKVGFDEATGIDYTDFEVQTHELAVGVVGTLTGYESALQASPEVGTTEVDYATKKDAFGFSLGYGDAKTKGNVLKEKSMFFYDVYGNMIGMAPISTTASYAVLDAIVFDHAGFSHNVLANLVDLDANNIDNANVVMFNGVKLKDISENDGSVYGEGTPISENANENDEHVYYLYTYSETDGDYTLYYAAKDTVHYYYREEISHEASDDNLFYYDGEWFEMNNETVILARDVNGEYKSYTGFRALPELSAAYAEVILDDNGEAEVVFLNDVVYADAALVGYIVNANSEATKAHTDGNVYYVYNFYVGDTARKIYLKTDDAIFYYGIYEAQFNAVDGLLVVNNVKTDLDGTGYYDVTGNADGTYVRGTIENIGKGKIAIEMKDGTVVNGPIDEAAVYEVDLTSEGTKLEALDLDQLDADDLVDVIFNTKNQVVAIYRIVE